MKKKIQEFMIKSPIGSFCLFGLPFGLIILLLYWFLEAPFWLGCILALIFMFCIYTFIDLAPTLYLQESAKLNDQQCDPYPLLEETEKLLSLKLKPNAHFSVSLNHATALINTGDTQKAEEIFSALDISICQNPLLQFNYFTLSAEIAISRKREDHAAFCIDRMAQIACRLKPANIRKMSADSLLFIKAGMALLQKEPDAALELLHKIQPTLPIHLVNHSLLLGQAYMAHKNWELAEIWLQQTIQTGNRLYAVDEARSLLAKIEVEKAK